MMSQMSIVKIKKKMTEMNFNVLGSREVFKRINMIRFITAIIERMYKKNVLRI